MTMTYLKRIATAVPQYDMHNSSIVLAKQMLADPRQHRGRDVCVWRGGFRTPILVVGYLAHNW
jgi:hypothetical protein